MLMVMLVRSSLYGSSVACFSYRPLSLRSVIVRDTITITPHSVIALALDVESA